MRCFLDLLVSHDCSPASAACPACLSLQKILAFMGQEIFSTVVFETHRRKNGDNRAGMRVDRPPLFAGILPGECTRIAATARVKEFTRGEMLYVKGDSVRHVLLLISGFVKVTRLGMNGTEVILSLGVPGESSARWTSFLQAVTVQRRKHLGCAGRSAGMHPLSKLWRTAIRFCTKTWFKLLACTCWNSRIDIVNRQRRELVRGSPGGAITGKDRPASQWRGRTRPFARRTGADERHDVVHRKSAALGLGKRWDRKDSS